MRKDNNFLTNIKTKLVNSGFIQIIPNSIVVLALINFFIALPVSETWKINYIFTYIILELLSVPLSPLMAILLVLMVKFNTNNSFGYSDSPFFTSSIYNTSLANGKIISELERLNQNISGSSSDNLGSAMFNRSIYNTDLGTGKIITELETLNDNLDKMRRE